MPKSASISAIKSLRTYTSPEAAEITGVSDRTIRTWIRDGLPAMIVERPILLHGAALIAFIKAQRTARKTAVDQDVFYCLKCRTARKPAERLVVCETDGSRVKLTGICEVCGTIMHKPVALSSLPSLASIFDLTHQDTAEVSKPSAAA